MRSPRLTASSWAASTAGISDVDSKRGCGSSIPGDGMMTCAFGLAGEVSLEHRVFHADLEPERLDVEVL